MKKRILLITAFGAMAYVTLTSNSGGAALSGNIRNGTKGTSTSCGGGGCHGTGAGTTASIRVDSVGGVQVTRYVPGMTYTVTVSGTNTTGNNKFGLQYSAVSGSGTSQIQAGTFSSLASGLASHTPSSIAFIEQSSTITGTSGVLTKTFSWTAPTANVGNVTMYLTVNAVNGDGSENAADVSGNTSIVLTRIIPASVGNVTAATAISAYPNPTSGTLNLQFTHAENGAYSIAVFDLAGRKVTAQTAEINGVSASVALDASNWTPGLYNAVVEKDGTRQVVQVVKQ